MTGDLSFYASPGPMTGLDGIDGLPTDPAAVAATVQGLIVHVFWAQAYGIAVSPDREAELQTRAAARMAGRMLELDPRPLTDARPPERRFVGNCRHFTTFSTAMLRRAGVPARARCGFAGYFEPGKWVDHWVTEWW